MVPAMSDGVLFAQRFDSDLKKQEHEGEKSTEGVVSQSFRSAVWVTWSNDAPIMTLLDFTRYLVPHGVICPRGLSLPEEGTVVVRDGEVLRFYRSNRESPVQEILLKGPGVNLDSSDWTENLDFGYLQTHMKRLQSSLPDEGRRILAAVGNSKAMRESRRVDSIHKSQQNHEGKTAELPALHNENISQENRRFSPQKKISAELDVRVAKGLGYLVRCLAGEKGTEENCLSKSCMDLLGLGDGLTPTGDDLLTAASAVCHRFSGSRILPFSVTKRFCETLCRLPLQTTTKAGREVLLWAAEGVFAEPLSDLMGLLGKSGVENQKIDFAISRLLGMGGRSGCDLLTGVVALTLRFCDFKK